MSKTDNIIDITDAADLPDRTDRTELATRYDVAAERIAEAHKEALKAEFQALRKVVVCGLLMLEQKEKLPHGQFLPWLEKNCPNMHRMTATRWMQTTTATLGLLQMSHDVTFEDGDLADVLSLPEEQLISEEAKEVQQRVWGLVDGSSAKHLVSTYKSTQEGPHQKYNPPKQMEAVSKEEAARLKAEQADRMAGELILSMGVMQDQVIHLDYDRLEQLNDFRIQLGQAINGARPIAKKRASCGN